LAEPRSSAAPYFDGQRWLSAGTVQVGACAKAAAENASVIAAPNVNAFIRILPREGALETAPQDK
jgi:hypothetical protein